jgi:ketosteroid isomerase-like protein
MPFTGSLEDRTLIRELYGRYGDASWRGDREAWLDCFTADGRWVSHLFNCTGKAELAATWDSLWKDWTSVAFLSEIGSIEASGDRAKVRSYAREIVQLKSGGIFKLAGHYDDELVRQNGQWLFASRIYKLMIAEVPEGMTPPST